MTMKTGIDLIADERKRQIEKEGWTAEHDANHTDDTLALAGVCYAIPSYLRKYEKEVPFFWPWDKESWKPTPDNRIKELVKAGALIAAEIDKLQEELVQINKKRHEE